MYAWQIHIYNFSQIVQKGALYRLLVLERKRLPLMHLLIPMQDIYYDLLSYFPQLRDAGGFELMRTSERGGKRLEVIAVSDSGYNVPFLKAVVHHAKIYIRPLQNNLSLSPIKNEVDT